MAKIFSWVKRHVFLCGSIVLILIGGVYFFMRSNQTTETPTIQTTVVTVKRGDLSLHVSGSGQIQARSQVDLKPVAAGDAIEVVSVNVKNDQPVVKGQTIAVLDNEDASRSVARARLDLSKARIQMKKTEDLYSKQTVDDTRERKLQEASVKESEIALGDALSRLSDYTIRAPFDGIVTGLTVDSGGTVSQTGILASVITKDMKAVITLNEVDAAKVLVGNTVTLSLDALPGTTLLGKIAKLDTIGTTTQGVVSYGAEIMLDNQDARLKPGMSMTADILVQEKKNVLLVPNEAITSTEGKAMVRVINTQERGSANPSGRGVEKQITVGITDNVSTEILDGLNEGDRLIVSSSTTGSAAVSQTNRNNQGGFFNLFRGNTNNRGNFNR